MLLGGGKATFSAEPCGQGHPAILAGDHAVSEPTAQRGGENPKAGKKLARSRARGAPHCGDKAAKQHRTWRAGTAPSMASAMRRACRGIPSCTERGSLGETAGRSGAAKDASLVERTLSQCSRFADFGVVVHGAHEQKRPQIFLENAKEVQRGKKCGPRDDNQPVVVRPQGEYAAQIYVAARRPRRKEKDPERGAHAAQTFEEAKERAGANKQKDGAGQQERVRVLVEE
jgi:hypothetical protein